MEGENSEESPQVKETFPKPADYDSWTQCKKDSWDQMEANPNGFFYRHVLPNETRKNGSWSDEEKKLFVEALRKTPKINSHWGLFARNIPGRVGYQCHHLYLRMVDSGELKKLAPDLDLPPQRIYDTSKHSKYAETSYNESAKLDDIEEDSLFMKEANEETTLKQKLKSPLKGSSETTKDFGLYF